MNIFQRIYGRMLQAAYQTAIPYLPYRQPQLYYSLEDIPQVCRNWHVGRLLIVTDCRLVRIGLCDKLQQVLQQAGIQYVLYADAGPNPTTEQVEAVCEGYKSTGSQAFVALGGGSVIDCCKAAACRIVRPQKPVAQLAGRLRLRQSLPLLIAVPTTAGTGSEATPAAYIAQPQHHPYAMLDFPLVPRVAVLDYHLTQNLPPHLTATTGMVALAHAIETYISTSTTPYTRQMAIEAVTLINRHLLTAYATPDNAHARQGMLRASYAAGAAYSQHCNSYVQSLAHALQSQYDMPYALASAVLLPIVLRKYGSVVYPRLAQLARKCQIVRVNQSDAETAQQFIAWVQMLNDRQDIPRKLTGIQAQDIPTLAAHAAHEANPLCPAPVLWSRQQLEEIFPLCSL